MRTLLTLVLLALLAGTARAQRAPGREVWSGTCEADLRPGQGHGFRLVSVSGRPLNTPIDVEPGTRVAFSGRVGRDEACATIRFSKPVRNHNGMALLRAVPAGASQTGGLVDGALASLPGWARRLMSSKLATDTNSVLDSTPVYLKEMKLQLARGGRTVEQETRCEARICRIFRIPITTRLSIPLDRLSPRLSSDVRELIQGDMSTIDGFLQAIQGERLIDLESIPR